MQFQSNFLECLIPVFQSWLVSSVCFADNVLFRLVGTMMYYAYLDAILRLC